MHFTARLKLKKDTTMDVTMSRIAGLGRGAVLSIGIPRFHDVFRLHELYRLHPSYHFLTLTPSAQAFRSEVMKVQNHILHISDMPQPFNASMHALCLLRMMQKSFYAAFLSCSPQGSLLSRSTVKQLLYRGHPDWNRICYRHGLVHTAYEMASHPLRSISTLLDQFPELHSLQPYNPTGVQLSHRELAEKLEWRSIYYKHAFQATDARHDTLGDISGSVRRSTVVASKVRNALTRSRTSGGPILSNGEKRAQECCTIAQGWMRGIRDRSTPLVSHIIVEKMLLYLVRLYNMSFANDWDSMHSTRKKLLSTIALVHSILLHFYPKGGVMHISTFNGRLILEKAAKKVVGHAKTLTQNEKPM